MGTRARVVGVGVATVLTASLAVFAAPGTALAAAATVTIDAPVGAVAGQVRLTGTVGLAPGEVTSVLYVFDTTDSTAAPTGFDCSGNGSVGGEDDLNGDGVVGDVLDCEESGILALNSSLIGASGLQAGIVAFANQAATANLDPSGSATFLAPGDTGGDSRPRIETVARSVTRGKIGLYDPKALGGSGSGTAFNNALRVALGALASAPAGPKWIMFLSDGQSPVDDGMLDQLSRSGVKLRSFGIGAGASCTTSGSLYKMASATGETCGVVHDPASLAAGLAGSRPDSLNGVTVAIKDVSVAAQLNAVGGWAASFNLGAGTYTATATATLASGATPSARRTFTVAAAAGGPPPGTVSPGDGSLSATAVRVDDPAPTRSVLPKRVTGVAGLARRGIKTTKKLAGAAVLLQARAQAGEPWATVDHDRLDRAGRFALHWHPKAGPQVLRVVLLPSKRYAGSAAAVPPAQISACAVRKHHRGWVVTCLTTARGGSPVRLVENGKVVGQTKVRHGSFRLRGQGAVGRHSVEVLAGSPRLRLHL